MSISVMGTGTPSDGGGIPEVWDDNYLDIDRWENDGGSSLRTRIDRGRDRKMDTTTFKF
ncbi:hypothetical protein ACQKM9_04735 [Viridibacillus sp. NPDC093762]|uniref:hypothetical protein n=1 Tax=Viridibacillus sp. NPDC093762 TaxID=3390720 RepID=UPI003D05438E